MMLATDFLTDAPRLVLAATSLGLVAQPIFKADRDVTVDFGCFAVALALCTSMTLVNVLGPAGAASERVAILISTACNLLAVTSGLWLCGKVERLPAFTRREMVKLLSLAGSIITTLALAPAAQIDVVSQLDLVCSAAILAFLCAQLGRRFAALQQSMMANLAVVAAVLCVSGQALYLSAPVAKLVAGAGLVLVAYLFAKLPRPAAVMPVTA